MADVKISALPAATTPLAGTEVLPIVQSATTKQVSIANVTAGRAISATSLTLTTPLAVTSGGTGITSLGTNVATALGNAVNSASGICVQDASGNLGVGVTPSSWISTVRAFEVGLGGSGFSSSTANGNLNFLSNVYLDASSNYVYVRNSAAVRFVMSNTAGDFYWYTAASGTAGNTITFKTVLTLDNNANLVLGSAALATSATNGFLYLPTCAGAPTGTPTSYTGRAPIVYDTTNNKIYVYNGAWKATAALT